MRKNLLLAFAMVLSFVANAQNPEIENLWEKLYKEGKIEYVLKEVQTLLLTDSTNIELHSVAGRAYFKKGDIDKAIFHLKKSTNTDNPKSHTKAWGYNYLGRCFLLKGDLKLANDYLLAAYKMKATSNCTKSSYGLMTQCGFTDYYKDWKTVESDHFIFIFQTNDKNKINYFVETREKAYDSISKFLNVNLDQKIKFIVWDSRSDAKKVLKRNLGFAKSEIYLIHTMFNQTHGHEITHVLSRYLHDHVRKTNFINEGIAVYLDITGIQDREKFVKEAMVKMNMKKISVMSFWNEWKKYSDEISYPLAGLFVDKLIQEYGKDKFIEFFKDQSYENAKKVFGKGFEDFVESFETKFNEILNR